MTTPLQNLMGIQKRFNDSVGASEYLKAKPALPQVAPGSAATKVMLNKPGVAGASIAAPAVKPGMMRQVSKYLPRAAVPLIDAGMQIQAGKNPYDAAGRAIFGGVGGFIGSAGAAFLGAEPFDPITSSMAGYKVGYDQGADLYEKIRGYKPSKPTAPSASDMMSGSRGPEKPKPKLSTLQPGDDIPKSQYPAGVPTGIGGGNAGAAQSINPDASGYIPPTGEPLSVGTDTSSGGREVVSDADEAMRIWAQTHGQLADKVIDKVENRGLKQAGYDVIKSVRQPGESAAFPVTMAGEKPEIPYSDDKSGTEALNREGIEAFPVEMKTKDATSEFSPAFGAQNFLKDYMNNLKGKKSTDYEVEILSTPAELQDPVVMPAGNVEFSVPEVKTKLKRRS